MPHSLNAPLVEREPELASLDALLAEASAGSGHLALIEGPAGIGKSQLLEEARERAGDGMTVLAARASELERDFPFGVVRQLFETLLADREDRDQLLSGAADAARPIFEAPGSGQHEGGSFATLHGLFWLTLNLAEEQPLLLAIDDLHWCDRPSLRFVGYLARRLEGVAVLVAATRRSSDPGTDPGLLADIGHDALTVTLRPRPLSPDAVSGLVRARLGGDASAAFCDACHDATGGNPLLLRQLLSALDADGVAPTAANAARVAAIGPRAVSRTVLPRLARLPEDARAVAAAISVLGDSAGLPVVAALAEVPEAQAAEATGDLARAEILRPDLPLGFVHPLVRDAVYAEISPGERARQHARAATLLSEASAPADNVAAQLLHTAPAGQAWVARLLQDAGRDARHRGAADSAVAYLRRALDEPPPATERADVLYELGRAESLTSAPAAIEHLHAAYEELDDVEMRLCAANELSRLWCFSPTPQRGMDVARQALALVPEDRPDHVYKLLASEAMSRFFVATDLASVRELERYRDGIDHPGIGARMLEAMAAFAWMLEAGPADRCSALALRALAGTELVEQDDTFFVVAATDVLVAADDPHAMTIWEQVQAEAHRSGSQFAALGFHMWSGFTLLHTGDLAEAEARLRQSARENELWGIAGGAGTAYTYGILGSILVARGDPTAAREVLARAQRPVNPTEGENHVRRARAELALAARDVEEALAVTADYAEHGAYIANPAWSNWRSLRGQALALADRGDEALALVRDEVEAARAFGAPRALGRALRALAVVDPDRAIEHLEEAVGVVEGSPARLEHALGLAAYGAALRRARSPRDAREPLRHALELAAQCGADALADEVRTELYATGARPRGDAMQGAASLTPSERRVAGLAAEGETNKAIAQHLFVTPKTVEVHLSNAYRKLGIRSRRELAGALATA